MAVFDSYEADKLHIDDTQPITCTIDSFENQQRHTTYCLKVQRGPFFDSIWFTCRRYSDFDALNNQLMCSGLDLPLPPKKVFGKFEREFIAERKHGLQAYIDYVLGHPFLASALCVKKFFDPEGYSFDFKETALQCVSMVFRSETQWEVGEPLCELGWRIRKQFFLAKSKEDSRNQYLLSWMTYGPYKSMNDKDMAAAVKLLTTIKHPFIYSPTFTSVNANGVLVIYNFFENGSLRDYLCKVKPKSKFLKKYGKPKAYATIETDKIQKFGRQILLTLKFLHERNLFHGHLHSGNIVIDGDICKIIELESSVLGIPSMLKPYFSQLRKVQTTENIDIYCFGHIMYEMAFGNPLQQNSCSSFPTSCAPELRSVLEAILSTEACKKGLPSASDLLLHPFFSTVPDSAEEKVHFKVPSHLKESLKQAKERIENRLRDEQRIVKRHQRIIKAHALAQLSLDEEKKKRGERKKQQKSNQDSSQNGVMNSPTPSDNSVEIGMPTTDGSSVSPLPPPPPPMAPPPPPLPPPMAPPMPSNASTTNNDRGALLSSIQGFNKTKLKKSETKDCSAPKL